jgi:membrane-bound metal-dependent hydrolase YbcI (DUF457 family)
VQSSSHRIFNIAIASNVIVNFHKKYFCESLIIAAGLVLCSSLPDNIEQFGLKHRGNSHSVIIYSLIALAAFLGLTFYPALYWEYFCIFGMVAGCLGHIFADAFSKNGIKIYKHSIRFNFYKTGKYSERVFLFVFVMLNVLWLTWPK